MQVYYSKEHSWVAVDAKGIGTVGITDYGQAQLGDIVFAEVPPIGAPVEQGREAATIESIKAAQDIVSPVTGRVIARNATVEEQPSLINVSPEGEGWLFRVRLDKPDELASLLDPVRYQARVAHL